MYKRLVGQSVLATLAVRPPPKTLTVSLKVHTHITEALAPVGELMHYRQAVCPVTKMRLEKLEVLVKNTSTPEELNNVLENLNGAQVDECTVLLQGVKTGQDAVKSIGLVDHST